MSKYLKVATFFFVITWLLLLGYLVNSVIHTLQSPICAQGDISRRVTAPAGGKTALLERDLFFDLNFRLYIVDAPQDKVPCDKSKALWSSRDYEPTTLRDWHEEVEWSADSSIIAVSIEKQYVFAYDFNSGQRVEDPERIQSLLKSRKSRN